MATEKPRLLTRDEAETKLWLAIKNIKIGNKTDDKLILNELAKLGCWISWLPGFAASVSEPDVPISTRGQHDHP